MKYEKRIHKQQELKIHIATNNIKKVILKTSTRDNTKFDEQIEDKYNTIFTNSDYYKKSKKNRFKSQKKNIFVNIINPRVKIQSKLNTNKRFAKIRCLVDLPFTFKTQYVTFKETRYLRIKTNNNFLCLSLSYDLRRVLTLLRTDTKEIESNLLVKNKKFLSTYTRKTR